MQPRRREQLPMNICKQRQTSKPLCKVGKKKRRLRLHKEHKFHQGDAHGCELHEMSYEPLFPDYRGSPTLLTNGPNCCTETPPHFDSPTLPEVDKAVVEEYMVKLRAQQEHLNLLENPTTTPKVFKATLKAFHENQEVSNNIHVKHLMARPSGTQHNDDSKAKVKEEELESPLLLVSLPSSTEALPI